MHELAGGVLHFQELEDLAGKVLVDVLLAYFNVAVQLQGNADSIAGILSSFHERTQRKAND